MIRNHHLTQAEIEAMSYLEELTRGFRRTGRLRSLQAALAAAVHPDHTGTSPNNISAGITAGIRRFVLLNGLGITPEDQARILQGVPDPAPGGTPFPPGQSRVTYRMYTAGGANVDIDNNDDTLPINFTWEGLTPLQTAIVSAVDPMADRINLTALEVLSIRHWGRPGGGVNPDDTVNAHLTTLFNNGFNISGILRMRRSVGTPDPPGIS